MRISPHCHAESPLTGSTLSALVKRAKELGRSHFAYTDHGHLSSCLKAYGEAKKAGLKFAPGIEFYFKDSFCPITNGTPAARCKYFTGTLYATTQAGYQALCKEVSKGDLSSATIYDDKHQLWDWARLKRLSAEDTLLVLGGPHCMVGKAMLADGPEVAEKVFQQLRALYGKRLYVAMTASEWGKRYANVVEIEYLDGTRDGLLSTDRVTSDKAKNIKAIDLVNRTGHSKIESKVAANTFQSVQKGIKAVKLHKGFLPLPGGDVTLRINQFLFSMSKKYGAHILVTDYAYYATKPDKIVQTMVLGGSDKLYSDLHMREEKEFQDYLTQVMGLSASEAEAILCSNDAFAAKFDDFKLEYKWRLAEVGEDPLRRCMEIIQSTGRMRWDDPTYTKRLRLEIGVISKNVVQDFSGYFLPIYDIVNFYAENDSLTGPGRGSAGGSLFLYCMGVTQIDPIKWGLSFPRFLSADRLANGDVPDVDSDFPDRELLVGKDGKSGYLYGRWGNRAAQISTRHTVRLKSAVTDTNRYMKGAVEDEIKAFSKSLPDPPQGVSDSKFVFGYEDSDGNHEPGLIEKYEPLKDYSEERPEEWSIVQKAIGITRAHSQHASAFVLSDVPVSDVLPVKDGHITQYEAKQCEAAGLIKYDFLVVLNIKDIEVCLKLINKKNDEKKKTGYFTHRGEELYIWDLPHDPDVFRSIWGGDTQTLFQLNTKSMIPFVKDICPDSVEDISTILALVRPGPMDYINEDTGRSMAEEFVCRRKGTSTPDLQELYDLIPETHGVIVFQEQATEICKKLAGMDASDAEKLRRLWSKKQKVEAQAMKPIFMSTAIAKIGEEKANKIWDMLETSSRYSFNKSHSVAYALISHAGMFLKHHYPLEWWAAILTNASEKEISGKLWTHVRDIVAPPDINLSTDEMVVDYANEKIRAKLGVIRGMGDATIEPIVANRPYKDIQDFVNKGVAGDTLSRKLIHIGVLDSLFPAKITFLEKLQMFEDALEIKSYNKKLAKATEEGRELRAKAPRVGVIPDAYLKLENTPMANATAKKAVLPTLMVGMFDLATRYSKALAPGAKTPSRVVVAPNQHKSMLLTGEELYRLDNIDPELVDEDKYVAACGFVVEMKEFQFANKTKSALKLTVDFDGMVCEKVLWPDYNTQELSYPKELKKGSIVTFFLKKRLNRKDPTKVEQSTIQNMVIEA